MSRRTALVVAPGRGTYGREELGYLARYCGDRAALLERFDAIRAATGQTPVTALDTAERFSVAQHTRGDNASALIHACAYCDFQAIDRDAFEIVAVTGNSMGWYIALTCGGALDPAGGFELVNRMGTLMQEALIGGQLICSAVDDDWNEIPGRRAEIAALVDEIEGLHLSIRLGGMVVLGGTAEALDAAERRLPAEGRFPMRLANHAAFHTPLQAPVAERGQAALPPELFGQPALPLIDGRGHVWFPPVVDVAALRDYTLGHQVVASYDFTAAIRGGLLEFAPDVVIVLGPGTTLGGAVGQAMTACAWRGLSGKAAFARMQSENPCLLSMGRQDQRDIATGAVRPVKENDTCPTPKSSTPAG